MPTKTISGKAQLDFTKDNGEQIPIGETQDTVVEFTTEEEAPRRIETLEDAARYAYGLAETRKEIEKIQDVAAKEIAKWQEKIQQVEEWQAEVLKPLLEKVEYFSNLLMDYHMREYYNAPNDKARAKLKSIKLPYGVTLASREMQPKLEISDEAALLNYARENGFVEVVEKAKWAEIKKQLTTNGDKVVDSNGEQLEFIKVVPQERKFEVK